MRTPDMVTSSLLNWLVWQVNIITDGLKSRTWGIASIANFSDLLYFVSLPPFFEFNH